MSKLKHWIKQHDDREVRKFAQYLDIYERYLNKFIDKSPCVLEIGVKSGGSLQMWRDYFGTGSFINGIDINPNCKEVEEGGIKIFIGDQANTQFLEETLEAIGVPDIIVDDGGHTMVQQKKSFEFLFPRLADGGIYICEDLHTSYWKKWGGGLGLEGTFIEYAKALIDYMHAFYTDGRLNPNYMTNNIQGIHFYDSMVVVEKEKTEELKKIKAGGRRLKKASK